MLGVVFAVKWRRGSRKVLASVNVSRDRRKEDVRTYEGRAHCLAKAPNGRAILLVFMVDVCRAVINLVFVPVSPSKSPIAIQNPRRRRRLAVTLSTAAHFSP